jgi:hypothetical protein
MLPLSGLLETWFTAALAQCLLGPKRCPTNKTASDAPRSTSAVILGLEGFGAGQSWIRASLQDLGRHGLAFRDWTGWNATTTHSVRFVYFVAFEFTFNGHLSIF